MAYLSFQWSDAAQEDHHLAGAPAAAAGRIPQNQYVRRSVIYVVAKLPKAGLSIQVRKL
jgi:hypothetical protein